MLNMDREISYSPKAHDWDFTLSAKREIATGGGTVQATIPVPVKPVHTLVRRGADVVKMIGRHFVQSLQRIVS
ncbi:MAG: hypothetical protein A4E19_14230 [Nitrospira sp. SG-bin1]|nr:MAG: hypothetical protein A4E19_14230 [Nitrospira sp. SG-bin1]